MHFDAHICLYTHCLHCGFVQLCTRLVPCCDKDLYRRCPNRRYDRDHDASKGEPIHIECYKQKESLAGEAFHERLARKLEAIGSIRSFASNFRPHLRDICVDRLADCLHYYG